LSTPWRDAVAGLDLATAACAALNLAYFCARLAAQPPETASRRAAALVLAVVSLATIVEAVALTGAAWHGDLPLLASGQWALVRLLPLAGALGMSALIVRRLINDWW